jgi:hypothetical protein
MAAKFGIIYIFFLSRSKGINISGNVSERQPITFKLGLLEPRWIIIGSVGFA